MGNVSEKFRRQVYELVSASPGLTIGGIAKALGRGETATKTALNWLERNECIVLAADSEDRRRRWYKAIAPYPLTADEKLAAIRLIVSSWNADEAIVRIKEILDGD